MNLFVAMGYFKNKAGAAAIVFGMIVPVVLCAMGLSVDVAQAYLVRERLTHALDAAALAAAASASDDPHEIEQKVLDFMDANYPDEKIGRTMTVEVTPGVDTLAVNATARLDTSFMKVFGYKTVDVSVETEIKREVKAIEVALVMDVTGSMSTNNNIGALRTAATNFVNTMFDRTQDHEYIKIGLVPFSTSVNVGRYGLGRNPDGSYYDTPFVSNPRNIEYYDPFGPNTNTTANKRKWKGCIRENGYPDDSEDHQGPWSMYRYCRNNSDSVVCDTNNANNDANYVCPRASILPLTNDKQALLNTINQLQASGNTYVNVGLVWGLRLISPGFPFREAVAWEDPNWKKAVILMTDGENQAHPSYSVYGVTSSGTPNNATLNNRVEYVCNQLKSKGVLVYTITFTSGISNATKRIYERCASQPSMWYDAPTQARLIQVYGTIAKELSNLHITK